MQGWPAANDHPEGPASCKWWSAGIGLLHYFSTTIVMVSYREVVQKNVSVRSKWGAGLLQMIILRAAAADWHRILSLIFKMKWSLWEGMKPYGSLYILQQLECPLQCFGTNTDKNTAGISWLMSFLSLFSDMKTSEVFQTCREPLHAWFELALALKLEESIPDNCRRRGRRRQCKFFWPV